MGRVPDCPEFTTPWCKSIEGSIGVDSRRGVMHPKWHNSMELLSPFKTKQLQNSEFSPSFISFQPKLLVVGVLFCFALLYFGFFYDKVQRLNHLLLYLPVSHNGVNECWERCFVLAERQITTHTLLLVQVLETFSFWKSLKYFFLMWIGVPSFQLRDYVILVKDGGLLWQHILSGISWESQQKRAHRSLLSLQRCQCSLGTVWVAWFLLLFPREGHIATGIAIQKSQKDHSDFTLFKEKSFPNLLPSKSAGLLVELTQHHNWD